jgi:hypothetical protein
MIEAAGRYLGRVAEQLRDRVHHGGQHLFGVLLDPAGPWMRQRLLAACFPERAQLGVEEDRLDGRRPLVDAEQRAQRLPTKEGRKRAVSRKKA